jgi:divinyl protochlorophyllide a 8-vinyl-reductase
VRAAPPAHEARGRIGPNAVLQLVPILERIGGRVLAEEILAGSGLDHLSADAGMIDEKAAAGVHRALRRQLPDLASSIAAEAGRRTADYILAHRIPARVQRLLKALPAGLASRLLARAIARHAWTFAGSGCFEVVRHSPPVFELHGNPLVRGERADACLCHWHTAVFERLFRALASPDATVRETVCAAQGRGVCRFEVRLDRQHILTASGGDAIPVIALREAQRTP